MAKYNKPEKKKNKELIVDQLKKTPIIQVVCEKTGVPRSNFYRWRKEDAGFAEEVDEALSKGRQIINDMAESQLISAIKERNMTAIIFWLKNNHKSYKTRVELEGKLKTEQELTPEQEKQIKRALKMASIYKEDEENKGGDK
jgi:hypothetical protein